MAVAGRAGIEQVRAKEASKLQGAANRISMRGAEARKDKCRL